MTTDGVVAYLEALLPTMTPTAAHLLRRAIDAHKAGR